MSTSHSQRNRSPDQPAGSKPVDPTRVNRSSPFGQCECLEEDSSQTAFSVAEMAMLISRYKRAVYERFSSQIVMKD